jgi:hypothetical protein
VASSGGSGDQTLAALSKSNHGRGGRWACARSREPRYHAAGPRGAVHSTHVCQGPALVGQSCAHGKGEGGGDSAVEPQVAGGVARSGRGSRRRGGAEAAGGEEEQRRPVGSEQNACSRQQGSGQWRRSNARGREADSGRASTTGSHKEASGSRLGGYGSRVEP